MSCDYIGPEDGSRKWRTPAGVRIGVCGLPPPELAVEILQLIDSKEVDVVLTARIDHKPIFLYPEPTTAAEVMRSFQPPAGMPTARTT